jgi:hypothetical protein
MILRILFAKSNSRVATLILSTVCILLLIFSNENKYFNNVINTNSPYNSHSQRIFCLIFTAPHKFKNKLPQTVLNVWASKCDSHIFVTKLIKNNNNQTVEENSFNFMQPEGHLVEDYENLTTKVLLAFKQVYREEPNHDYYGKFDDDTYVNIDNLRLFLQDKDPKSPVTYGYDFKNVVENGYHSG